VLKGAIGSEGKVNTLGVMIDGLTSFGLIASEAGHDDAAGKEGNAEACVLD
jgi:hypothetical protein